MSKLLEKYDISSKDIIVVLSATTVSVLLIIAIISLVWLIIMLAIQVNTQPHENVKYTITCNGTQFESKHVNQHGNGIKFITTEGVYYCNHYLIKEQR